MPEPPTAGRPLTFTWDNGTVGPASAYSWTVTGTHLLTVTAGNICGRRCGASMRVTVLAEWPYHLYLPLAPGAVTGNPVPGYANDISGGRAR